MHERYRRQTDGQAIAYSEREREFTFAKNWNKRYKSKHAYITKHTTTYNKLCYYEGPRDVLSVNACYFRRYGSTEGFKSDREYHSRASAVAPFDRSHFMSSYQCSIATMSLSCTVNEILSLVSPKFKEVALHIAYPFRGKYIMHALVLLCINQQTKFELRSFTDYRDMNNMIGAKCKNRSRDSDHVHSGVVYHRKPSTWLYSSCRAYKIWRLPLQSFRRYDCGLLRMSKLKKMGHATLTLPLLHPVCWDLI